MLATVESVILLGGNIIQYGWHIAATADNQEFICVGNQDHGNTMCGPEQTIKSWTASTEQYVTT